MTVCFAPNLKIDFSLDPTKDPIEKHISYSVSISLCLLQKIVQVRNEVLSSTTFFKDDPFITKVKPIFTRIVKLSLLSGATILLFPLHVLEVAKRISSLTRSIFMLLIALQFDFYEGNPWFTDPASQIPPKIAYTVLIGGATLLSAPYIAEEILFSNKTIIFSQSIDRSSFGLSTKAINWAYNS